MPSSFLHSAIPVAVLCGFAAGCASAHPRGAPADKPTITAEDIERNPNVSIERMLQAKASGVSVIRAPTGEIVVRIRGATSFTNTDEPLYLLDGLPFEPGEGGLLSGVDPYNIESIRLLRGADAVLHGIRGMNGVIAITTKKPEKPAPE